MKQSEQAVRRMIRRMNEIDRQEGRLRKYLDGLTHTKPSEKKKRKSSLAAWRRKIGPRSHEVRTLDGSIWKNGKLLSPRPKSGEVRSRIVQARRSSVPPGDSPG